MKIAILSPDLSHNCLGRAYLLAKILQRRYEVEVVGPLFGNEIWQPVVADSSITYKWVKLDQQPPWEPKELMTSLKPYSQLNDLAKRIDADALYASKPLFTSFGLGLLNKLREHIPLVLDIDDWQVGLVRRYGVKDSATGQDSSKPRRAPDPTRRLKLFLFSLLRVYEHNSPLNARLGEKLTRFANRITVSNTFLQEKFGGEIVYHGRDTHAFDPSSFNREVLRTKYNINKDDQVVMFLGSPMQHKGIMDLVQAVALIKDPALKLFLVGVNDNNPYSISVARAAKQALHERFESLEEIPFARVPELLTVADVVAIPQKRDFASIGQLPAKVFDAMAMAKPIVATRVNDLPLVLDGCGLVVAPGNPAQLASAIASILSNPEKAHEMGQLARERCVEKYSWDALERVLADVFKSIVF